MSKTPTFSTWFRAIRLKKKQTQIEAAAEIGHTGPTVCRWEKGGSPRAEHLEDVRVWSGVDARRLLKIVATAAA